MKLEVPFPMIYLPKYITIEPETEVGFYGEIEVIKKTRGIVTRHLKFRNVITDVGLKHMAEISQYAIGVHNCIYLCQLGTGTTTPTSSDTTLEAYSTYKQYSSISSGGATNDYYAKIQFEFGLSEAIGSWSELGMSWTFSSGSNVFCRMLFKDEGGNPITITKTSDDTMTIIYYLHAIRTSDTPTENTITIDSTTYTVQSLILNNFLACLAGNGFLNYLQYGQYSRLGTGTNALSTTQTACYTPIATAPSLYSTVSYVSGTFYREFMYEYPASVTGNISEFYFVAIGATSAACVAMRFPTPISKTDTTKKIRLQPRITYARAT